MCSVSFSPELIRFVGAAAISPEFCRLLLTDANLALEVGYRGTPFRLTGRECETVRTITAHSLVDFAAQLIASPINRE